MPETNTPNASNHDPVGVSVVVPAYNPGPYLERCLESLLTQTLDRSRYEIVFVDDGSTDGTGERLDRAAAEHPDLVRVLHIPNSGWPGRPRNLGTDTAVHDYVFYCDADDWLLPHALATLTERAAADFSDVVVSRSIGNRRTVPQALFERGDYCTDWRRTPNVFSNLTTQKMFRREFLRKHGLRFDEGKVRLEDFIFMTQAYLLAERISIVGSKPCYVFEKRDDGGNLTDTLASEQDYFRSVERLLDIVLANTEPGPDQDIALDRTVRAELIGPLSRPGFLGKSDEVRAEALMHGQRLLRERVPPSAVARLDVVTRRRAAAIERGDQATIERLIAAESQVTGQIVCTDVSWDEGLLHLELALELVRDGEVVRLTREGEQLFLPGVPGPDGTETERTDVTRAFAGTGVHVTLRSRDYSEEWRVRAKVTPAGPDDADGVALRWTATATIDFTSLAGGAPLRPEGWDAHANLSSCGFHRAARVQLPVGAPALEPPTVELGAVRVRPYWTPRNQLTFAVRPARTGTGTGRNVPVPGSDGRTKGRRRRSDTWQRRALKLARLARLNVTNVAPGVVLLSRSAAFDVEGVPSGNYLVSKRGRKSPVQTKKLRRGVTIVADAPDVRVVTDERLDDQHWIVKAAPAPGLPLVVAPVGPAGWLVARPDQEFDADIRLENQTAQYLAGRHVAWLLRRYDVDYVIDVGANTGQYAMGLRKNGYRGPIASFEPVPHFADAMDKHAASDDQWTVHRAALGRTEGTVPIRVQRTFSSLLPASDYGKGRFATLRDFAANEEMVDVPLRRLDSVLDELLATVRRADGGRPRVFLKMDTQGFDLEVFGGLGEWQQDVVGLQSEVALLLIYEGMPRMREALDVYEGAGYEISGLYPVTSEPDGRVIEYDCVMVRADLAP